MGQHPKLLQCLCVCVIEQNVNLLPLPMLPYSIERDAKKLELPISRQIGSGTAAAAG